MHPDTKTDPFLQYYLTHSRALLHQLPPHPHLTAALLHGCFLRNHFKLYRGLRYFIEDLQTVLDYDRAHAPPILK
jgi:hypothetical protein